MHTLITYNLVLSPLHTTVGEPPQLRNNNDLYYTRNVTNIHLFYKLTTFSFNCMCMSFYVVDSLDFNYLTA